MAAGCCCWEEQCLDAMGFQLHLRIHSMCLVKVGCWAPSRRSARLSMAQMRGRKPYLDWSSCYEKSGNTASQQTTIRTSQ
uniref:Uncharacterized protein n=1 Tax=Oryza meridionalis TaxID=40149 RepID=A0A0E0CEP3_9ORYZ